MKLEIKEEISVPKRYGFSKDVLDAASESETGIISIFLVDKMMRSNVYVSLHQYLTRHHLRDRFKVALRGCTVYVQELRDGDSDEA